MSAVRIYFDVDGVFNAVTRGTPQWGWTDEVRRSKVNGWLITYSPELVATVNEVTAAPGVESYWLTTWCHDAVEHLCPTLGINGTNWPVVGHDHWKNADDGPRSWWKFDAITEHLAGFEGEVLWIDDDLHYDAATVEWLKGQPHVIGICPRTELGVTKRQAETIRRVVAKAADA